LFTLIAFARSWNGIIFSILIWLCILEWTNFWCQIIGKKFASREFLALYLTLVCWKSQRTANISSWIVRCHIKAKLWKQLILLWVCSLWNCFYFLIVVNTFNAKKVTQLVLIPLGWHTADPDTVTGEGIETPSVFLSKHNLLSKL